MSVAARAAEGAAPGLMLEVGDLHVAYGQVEALRGVSLDLRPGQIVSVIGPNGAGKTTMLAAISRATPKVADYRFTTLSPNLGIAELPGGRRMVFADIPGLIEGAAEGAGLGHEFLRHIERTTVIVHLLDARPADGGDPAANYRVIREELQRYSEALAEKREIIVLNKIDLIPEGERGPAIAALARALPPSDRPMMLT